MNCYGIIASFQAWSFATSVFDTRQAKRLFGLIGAGAPLGAVLGGLLARVLVGPLGAANLLLVLAALITLAALLVHLTLRVIPRRAPATFEPRPVHLLPRTLGVVSRSRYLRAIAALVFLVAIVTQWTQFQFLLVAQERYARDADRLTAFLGEWNVYFGIVAFLVQVLFTGPALRRFGVAVTVFLLPVGLGLGSGLIVLFPVFWTVLLTSSFDQSLRFSIDKATFELLYLPLPASLRGGVKATIDIVFSRAADAVGGVLLGLATDGFRLGFLSLPGAGLRSARPGRGQPRPRRGVAHGGPRPAARLRERDPGEPAASRPGRRDHHLPRARPLHHRHPGGSPGHPGRDGAHLHPRPPGAAPRRPRPPRAAPPARPRELRGEATGPGPPRRGGRPDGGGPRLRAAARPGPGDAHGRARLPRPPRGRRSPERHPEPGRLRGVLGAGGPRLVSRPARALPEPGSGPRAFRRHGGGARSRGPGHPSRGGPPHGRAAFGVRARHRAALARPRRGGGPAGHPGGGGEEARGVRARAARAHGPPAARGRRGAQPGRPG